jgi:hypothetical protein
VKALLALAVSTLALAACGGAHPVRLRPTAAPAPATRWVGTHGIEVAVPAAWRLDREMCGTPKANTVLWLESGTTQCLTPQPLRLSVVEFSAIERGRQGARGTRVTIDGAAALRRSTGTVAGSHAVQLVFPHRGITVSVLSPHRSLLRRILASARVVRVDENGCPTRPAPVYRLGSRPLGPFVQKGAVRAIGCSYRGKWLDRSSRVGRGAAARLARALDAAPWGFSRAPRHSFLPSDCRPSWRDSLIVTRFEYAGGRPPVSVAAHIEGCSRLGASNGRWTVRMRPRWVFQIVRDARYSGGFVDPRTARAS